MKMAICFYKTENGCAYRHRIHGRWLHFWPCDETCRHYNMNDKPSVSIGQKMIEAVDEKELKTRRDKCCICEQSIDNGDGCNLYIDKKCCGGFAAYQKKKINHCLEVIKKW